jgi:hypothetical protein
MCGDERKTHSMCLVVSGGQLNTIPVNLYGRFHVKLSAIWYYAVDQNHEKLIQLRSRQMRLKYSSGNAVFNANGILQNEMIASPYPCFVYSTHHQVGGLNGIYHFEADFQGQMECELVTIWGDAVEANDTCVLNLELTPLEAGGSQ